MTQSMARETLVQATRDLPELRITEVVLQTARWQEMKDWYSAFLGVEPFFETETMCFRRVSSAHDQLFVLFHFPEVQDRPEAVTGLNHAQFKCNTLGEALDRYERLKAVGIVPVRSFNHGPGTSFYYRDPDGNTMEVSGPNVATEAEFRAYLQTEAFRSRGSSCWRGRWTTQHRQKSGCIRPSKWPAASRRSRGSCAPP